MPAPTASNSKDSTANIGFEKKMLRLVGELADQFAESTKLKAAIHAT